eukprot:CAMPEP_0206548040 /NCGR_PEP_ID=MMETSP0325_2-20121206/13651_1 /ASSEMBLY_ACC=CAM_ASM_000347 /TAXON_ID=2866 /ORGANISM="Crypthecodinium cohnii, Strain Seligo" /LENGTH=523 /DNA_ID=CAMNT_0054047453 /DNA_START=52 /DNA_END=1620 /DNA_ORIENTATION=+
MTELSINDDVLGAGSPSGKSSPGRRKVKKASRNIFLEFGLNSTDKTMQEVQIGGVLVKRYNMKRFWRSDHDLTRWKVGLHDRSRFRGLLDIELERCNPELVAEKADLQVNHNRLQRRKSDFQDTGPPVVEELRALKHRLEPKEKRRHQFRKGDFSELFASHRNTAPASPPAPTPAPGGSSSPTGMAANEDVVIPKDKVPTIDEESATVALNKLLDFLSTRYGTLEAAFMGIDANGNGEVTLGEFALACRKMGYRLDTSCLMQVLDRDASGSLALPEFLRLQPFLNSSMALSDDYFDGGSAGDKSPKDPDDAALPDLDVKDGLAGRSTSSRWRSAFPREVPQTGCTLFIFRNAYPGDAGQAVYFRKWPPASLSAVLTTCQEKVPLLVGPAARLLNINLISVKSAEEVQRGGVYLLQGQEALDPPARFLHSSHSGEMSFKKVSDSSHAKKVELEDDMPKPSLNISTSRQGSPPHSSSQPCLRQMAKWEVQPKIGMLLSHGGLGQYHQFHRFDTWDRALRSRRGID